MNAESDLLPGPVKAILDSYSPISLEETERVSLMNRTDTKFCFRLGQLPTVLEQAKEHYRVLEIGDDRSFGYRNLYYDTPDFRFYMMHHNGKQNRYKIRFREYVETRQHFLEVKFKSNRSRTVKKRIQAACIEDSLSEESARYIESRTPYAVSGLSGTIRVNFRRITLVHNSNAERITIDTGLNYAWKGQEASLPQLVIAEVKLGGTDTRSDLIRILKNNKIHPSRMSKYCTGMAMLYPQLKRNRFKEKLLTFNKIHSHDRPVVFNQ